MFEIQLYHLDVGQGDCTVIIIRESITNIIRRVIVVDCGGGRNGVDLDDRSGFVLVNFLEQSGVQRIDAIVITHYDADHLGGINVLLEEAAKGNVYISNLLTNTFFYDRGEPGSHSGQLKEFMNRGNGYIKYVKNLSALTDIGVRRMTELVYSHTADVLRFNLVNTRFTTQTNASTKYRSYDFEEKGFLLGYDIMNENLDGPLPITLRCVAVNRRCLDQNGQPSTINGLPDSENENSIAMLLSMSNFHYYLSGEVSQRGEVALIPYLTLQVQHHGLAGMKASHHGSESGTSPIFIDALRPRIVCISCGPSNQHEHPRSITMDTLEQAPSVERVLMTGYGGDPDDPRNSTYYNAHFNTSKFIIGGSEWHGQAGTIGIHTIYDDLNPGVFDYLARIYAQNRCFLWCPNDEQYRNWFAHDIIPVRLLLDEDGDSIYPAIRFDQDQGIGFVSDNGIVIGTLVIYGDFKDFIFDHN